MEQFYPQFLYVWQLAMWVATALFAFIGFIILITHWIKSKSYKDLKAKYDYLSI